MQLSQWASVAVAALALAYAAWQQHNAALARRASADAIGQATLEQLTKQLAQLADNSQQQLDLLRREMRDDRTATNQRLRYLEEHAWRT